MNRTVVQSTSLPAAVFRTNNGKLRGSGKNRTVKMICNFQLPRLRDQATTLRLNGFSGLRGSNALDTLAMPGLDFHSKIALSMTRPRGRGSHCVARAMFERFTEETIRVIMLAQDEAIQLGHNFVGTEQILLGLIIEGTGIAAKVLKSMGINLKDTRLEVKKIIGRGRGFVREELPLTPRAKRVLEFSLEEARRLGHNYVGSEHLLLGLLRDGKGVAARVLGNLGADPNNIRRQVNASGGLTIPIPSQVNASTGHEKNVVEIMNEMRPRDRATFERFTEKAIRVIMLAQDEARQLGHNFVGTEQILLGLINEGTGISAMVLKSMGINLKDTRLEVEKIIGRGGGFVAVEIPFTPRAKRVLGLSLEEARQLGHDYVGSEHLLLGLLREGEGVAARVLENLGVDPYNILRQVNASYGLMTPIPSQVNASTGEEINVAEILNEMSPSARNEDNQGIVSHPNAMVEVIGEAHMVLRKIESLTEAKMEEIAQLSEENMDLREREEMLRKESSEVRKELGVVRSNATSLEAEIVDLKKWIATLEREKMLAQSGFKVAEQELVAKNNEIINLKSLADFHQTATETLQMQVQAAEARFARLMEQYRNLYQMLEERHGGVPTDIPSPDRLE